MITGVLELDGFAYDIQEAHPAVPGPNGVPVPDKSRTLKVIHIEQPPGAGPPVRLVFAEADWEEFVRRVSGSRLVVASALPPRINGSP